MTMRVSAIARRLASRIKQESISFGSGIDRNFITLNTSSGTLRQFHATGSPSVGIIPDIEKRLADIKRVHGKGLPLSSTQFADLCLEVSQLRERLFIEQERGELSAANRTAIRLKGYATILKAHSLPLQSVSTGAETGRLEAEAQELLSNAISLSKKLKYKQVVTVIADAVLIYREAAVQQHSASLHHTASKLKALRVRCNSAMKEAPKLAPHNSLEFLVKKGTSLARLRFFDTITTSIDLTQELRALQHEKTMIGADEILLLQRADTVKPIPTHSYPNPFVDPDNTFFFLVRYFNTDLICAEHLTGTRFGKAAANTMETDFKNLWQRQSLVYQHSQNNRSEDLVRSLVHLVSGDRARAVTLFAAIRKCTKNKERWSNCAEYLADILLYSSTVFLRASTTALNPQVSKHLLIASDYNLIMLGRLAKDKQLFGSAIDKVKGSILQIRRMRIETEQTLEAIYPGYFD